MGAIIDDIKRSFKDGSLLTKVIYVNLAVFVIIRAVMSFSFLFGVDGPDVTRWLAVPSSVSTLILRPWTLITYMFLHVDFLHILFNLILPG